MRVSVKSKWWVNLLWIPTVSMQLAMQTPLDQAYQRLNDTGIQAVAQQNQEQAVNQERQETLRRM
jgi:hypothetical protein